MKLCDRNFGVGADGVIFAMPGVNGADYTMRIFNSDGSEPEVRSVLINPLFLLENTLFLVLKTLFLLENTLFLLEKTLFC